MADQVERSESPWRSLPPVQRISDRHLHVRLAQLCEATPILEFNDGVDNRLRMDHDFDASSRHPEQLLSFHDFEQLVEQGGTVDADPWPHLPGRMLQCLRWCDSRKLVTGHSSKGPA